MAGRQSIEHTVQRAVIAELERKGAVVSAIPNAAKRSRVTAARMKAEGMRAGTPDLAVTHCGQVHWIEVKGPKTPISDEQIGFALLAASRDVSVYLIRAGDGLAACQEVKLWMTGYGRKLLAAVTAKRLDRIATQLHREGRL